MAQSYMTDCDQVKILLIQSFLLTRLARKPELKLGEIPMSTGYGIPLDA